MKKVIIAGSGLTGITSAVELAENGVEVTVLFKNDKTENNSYKAQGGVAIPVSRRDSFERHYEDTLKAGKFLNDPENTMSLIKETLKVKDWLQKKGVFFEGAPAKEAAHSVNRILHIGDITGREIFEKLIKYIKEKNISIKLLKAELVDILTKNNKVYGLSYKMEDNCIKNLYADSVIMATGGVGAIFETTSNSPYIMGEGIAVAWRRGVELADMEFIQFHPTVLYVPHRRVLLSEAIRGEGGKIVDENGKRFLFKYHKDGELAPRDVVSFAITEYIKENNLKNVYLDVSHFSAEFLKKRFPNIMEYCRECGIDMTKDKIPVKPAAHYFIGGIKVDKKGRTSIKDLYAGGECAASFVHGANRLASNSLLECFVYGLNMAHEVIKNKKTENKKIPEIKRENIITNDNQELINKIRKANEKSLNIVRNKKELLEHLDFLKNLKEKEKDYKVQNLLDISIIISKSALYREESRGVHKRGDFPEKKDEFNGHFFIKNEEIKFIPTNS
ncbi:MAG: L-aspartate oxidase [Candidatus Muiribacteriota bacterium]